MIVYTKEETLRSDADSLKRKSQFHHRQKDRERSNWHHDTNVRSFYPKKIK